MMKSEKELRAERLEVFGQLKTLVEGAAKEERAMNGEEQEKFDRLDTAEKDLAKRADEAARREEIDRLLDRPDTPAPVAGVPDVPQVRSEPAREKATSQELGECFRAWACGSKAKPSQRTLEVANERGFNLDSPTLEMRLPSRVARLDERGLLEYRQQSTALDTTGGEMVPDEMMRAIDIALLQFGGVRQRATVVQTASGADLPIPTVDDTAVKGEIIAENITSTQGDITFGQIVLGSYKYSSKFVLVSLELMQDSATNIPALLGRLLGERIGRIENDHFTAGTGSGQPNGIVTAATDSTVVAASATALTYGELLALFHSVDPAYRGAGAGWMFNDTTLSIIRQIVDGDGRYIFQAGVAGAPDTIMGYPYTVNQSMSNGIDAKAVIFGQLDKYMIRDALGFTLVRLDERYAEFAQVAFLGWTRSDGNLIDAGTAPVKYLAMAAA